MTKKSSNNFPYRPKDYVTPRSMKQAYGYEPVLYVTEDKNERLSDTINIVLNIVVWGSAIASAAYLVYQSFK